MIAIISAYKDGFLAKQFWVKNIIAGLIVGIIALPLAMAFAIASGAKPEQGIYTAIIAGLTVSIFGGSRLQIAGPTGAFIVVLASITAEHGIIGLQLATLMAGVLLILMSIMHLGGIIRYIPLPVIIGFTAGIGVVIFVSQWPAFLGVDAPSDKFFHEKVFKILTHLHQVDWHTLIFGLSTLLLLILLPKIKYVKLIPASLSVLIIFTTLQAIFRFPTVETIGSSFGGIRQGLPAFALPTITFNQVISLIGPAFAIAMLGAIESLLSATVADNMAKTKHNPNQELMGQGLANILSPLFGGFAATGAIARTAANIKNGGTSPIAGIVHAFFLIAVILFLAPLAQHIPLSSLAAILFIVAWNMSEVKSMIKIIKEAPVADIIILSITFFMTVFTDLILAVNIGVLLAILYFLKQMSSHVFVEASILNGETILQPGCLEIKIKGPLFFAAIEKLEKAIAKQTEKANKVVFNFEHVPFIDATGLNALTLIIQNLSDQKVTPYFYNLNHKVQKILDRSHYFKSLPKSHFIRDLDAFDLVKSQTIPSDNQS